MKKIPLTLIIVFYGLKAIGQNETSVKSKEVMSKDEEKKGKEFKSKVFSKHLFSPSTTSTSGILSGVPKITLESDFGDQSASASIGFNKGQSTFSMNVKQPFDEKPAKVSPLTLDGLDNGTSLKLGFQHYFWKTKSPSVISNIFDSLKCYFYIASHDSSKVIPCKNLITITDGEKNTYYCVGLDKFDTIKIDSISYKFCCCPDSIKIYYPKTIISLNHNDSIKIRSISFTNLDSQTKATFQELITVKTYFFNASLSFAKNNFKYISDSFSISPVSIDKINQSYKISLGRIFNENNPDKLSVLLLSFVLSQSFEATNDPIDFSYPIGTLGGRYSDKVTIGVPVEKTNTRVSLEWRRNFADKKWLISNFAISPSISYLINKTSISLNLPVYLLNYKENDKVAGLNGGFELGYLTKTDQFANFSKGFTAGIFISAPFDLFGN